jgi:hypothetical protein
MLFSVNIARKGTFFLSQKSSISRKSQISIEYLSILGFVMITVTVLLFISYYYSRSIQDQIAMNQVDKLVKEIIDAAESVYYLGKPSLITIKATIPERVESINFANNEVTIVIRTKNGNTEISYVSSVAITGTLSTSPGIRYIKVEAEEGYVWVHT